MIKPKYAIGAWLYEPGTPFPAARVRHIIPDPLEGIRYQFENTPAMLREESLAILGPFQPGDDVEVVAEPRQGTMNLAHMAFQDSDWASEHGVVQGFEGMDTPCTVRFNGHGHPIIHYVWPWNLRHCSPVLSGAEMLAVYVAGPLNAPNAVDYLKNVSRMVKLAQELCRQRFAPFCPALDFMYGILSGDWEYEDYFGPSQVWLKKSDAVLAIAHSPGTDRETATAAALDIPVFWVDNDGIAALLKWRQSKERKPYDESAAFPDRIRANAPGLCPAPDVPVPTNPVPGLREPLSSASPMPDVPRVWVEQVQRVGSSDSNPVSSDAQTTSCHGGEN
jgi:hypothetical protein